MTEESGSDSNTMAKPELNVTRSEDRMPYITALEFHADNGTIYQGHTTDVSLGGAFLHTDGRPQNLQSGDGGVAQIKLKKKEQEEEFDVSFPCFVARVTDAGLGLNFDLEEMDEGEEEEEEEEEELDEEA
ncbi:MAG: PilZ domain-containing protein [Magnetococcales bacterium]|nr:PilZ domain-containing protein [Magnetococcales bacterium]